MRILAIRGSNLASLAGEFELNLTQSPLCDARLFVITGPVGAGKSTLLDALSVALFHRAPRFLQSGNGKWDDLSGDDARNLLSRGAVEGFAEVDFEADEGGSYRARWDVRRARRRVEGAIQKASCRLSCLQSGKLLGTGVKQTGDQIGQLLGLDFGQFQRAVLLAQGEFASFLKADSDQRSALLEQMTGTDLYGRVSKAAYQRAKAESGRAQCLQQEMNALQPIHPEEEAALQVQLQETSKQLQKLEGLLRLLDREKDWYTQERELRLDLETAQAEQSALLAQEPDFNAKKQELSLTETALSLSSWFTVIDEMKGQAGALTAGLETHKGALNQARERRDEAQRAVDTAQKELKAALIARHEGERVIDEAIKTDEQLRLLRLASIQAENRHQDANERKAVAERDLSLSRNRLSELRTTAQELEEFRTLNCDAARLFTEEKHWLEQILQYEKLKEDEAEKRNGLLTLSVTIEDLQKKEQGVSSELATESSEIERLEAALSSLQAEIAALEPDKLFRLQEDLLNHQERVAALERSHLELRVLLGEAQRISSERAQLVREITAVQSKLAETDSRFPALKRAAAEAERAWRTAVSSRQPNVETLRSGLIKGAPCPVCGALDHPWVSIQAPSLDQLVEKSRNRQEKLAEELAVVRGQRAEQKAHLAQLQIFIRGVDQRTKVLKPQQDRLRSVVEELSRELGLADPGAISQARTVLKTRLETVTKELRVIHDKEAVTGSILQELRSRRRIFEKHRALHAKLKTNLGLARSREASVTSLLSVRVQEKEKLANLISGALASLPDLVQSSLTEIDPASPQPSCVPPLLDRDPGTVRSMFKSRADEWKRKVQLLEEISRQVSAVEAEIACREHETAQATAELAGAQAALLASEREVYDLAAKRSLLLDGRSIAEARLSLSDQAERQRQACESAELHLRITNAEVTQVETTAGLKAGDIQLKSQKLAAKQAALEQKLRKRGLTEAEARRLASRGDTWCQETRQTIKDYENQQVRTRERIKERARQLRSHERSRPHRTCQDLEHLLQKTIEERKTLDTSVTELRAKLLQARSIEDRIRVLSVQLLSLEEEGRVWIELGELIGSADGKAFRNIAQTYTLDLLLDHANLHLAELKPRYRLERFPDDSAEPFGIFVVDRDMGDERRPVTTLSGGETFLVSLALALGLSSLHSRRVRLGSLFIDEGFGALDSASLQTALAALEALQLHDRQIGIISHIEDLAEHFPAEVRVVPLGCGTSRLEVLGR